MITEDYVSFEIAKLLKEKRFDEATIGYYYTISEIPEKIKFFDSPISIYDSDGLIGCIQAPTLQMAMKWLREKELVICILPLTFYCGEKASSWGYNIWAGDNLEIDEESTPKFATYEEASESAIRYCLENLI